LREYSKPSGNDSRPLLGSSCKIIFVDEKRETVIVNEYGEVNMDAVNEVKHRDLRIKIKEV
jgi:hypothetical protein